MRRRAAALGAQILAEGGAARAAGLLGAAPGAKNALQSGEPGEGKTLP
jgi:hypothetical protein